MNELFQSIDAYCERIDPSYWAEPLNAVTNLAFVAAALLMLRRVWGQQMPLAVALCVLLLIFSVGSWLLHTHATVWAAAADTIPVLMFIVLGIYVMNYDFLGLSRSSAILATLAFFPYVAAMATVFERLTFFYASAGYWPIALLIGFYVILIWPMHRQTAIGLAWVGGLLSVALVFRSVDIAFCDAWPYGTHFIWHIVNAVTLFTLMEVYRCHLLATRAADG